MKIFKTQVGQGIFRQVRYRNLKISKSVIYWPFGVIWGFLTRKSGIFWKFGIFVEFLSKFKVLYFEMSFQFPPGFFSFRSLSKDHQQFLWKFSKSRWEKVFSGKYDIENLKISKSGIYWTIGVLWRFLMSNSGIFWTFGILENFWFYFKMLYFEVLFKFPPGFFNLRSFLNDP